MLAVALELARATQLQVQAATPTAIMPDLPVNCIMTDAKLVLCPQVPGHRSQTPLLTQQCLEASHLHEAELLVALEPLRRATARSWAQALR